MRKWIHEHSLSLTMFFLFFLTLFGTSVTGHRSYNAEQRDHHEAAISFGTYLASGNFVEAVFENWESEFLQMGTYVLFTVWLREKGSPESKSLEGDEPQDADPRHARNPDRPWPVRAGGRILKLYENSLSAVLLLLFVGSWLAHAFGGYRDFNQQQLEHGGQVISMWRFVTTSEFWFQSFQNWQSEFMAVGALAVLAIWLRQRGSPESKPVAAPHDETGS
jgi:hypothetical protein